jgi:hypothetical protein
MLLVVVVGMMSLLVALEFEEGKRNIHIVRYLLTAVTRPGPTPGDTCHCTMR